MNEDLLIPDGVQISAKEGIRIAELTNTIIQKVFDTYITCDLAIPYHKGDVIAYINHQVKVLDVAYDELEARYQILCSPHDYQVVKEYLI